MCRLPQELFIAIFSLLPPRDLPSIIRLSRDFRDIGRPLLYKSVDLRSDDVHIQSTVHFLQQHSELSQNVERAILTTHQSSATPWIPPDFLNGWKKLSSLTIVGVPFHTINDQEIFRGNLIHSCTSLAHFAYRPGAVPFPGPNFEISGLKRLSWKTEQASKWPFYAIFTTIKTEGTYCSSTSRNTNNLSYEIIHEHTHPYLV